MVVSLFMGFSEMVGRAAPTRCGQEVIRIFPGSPQRRHSPYCRSWVAIHGLCGLQSYCWLWDTLQRAVRGPWKVSLLEYSGLSVFRFPSLFSGFSIRGLFTRKEGGCIFWCLGFTTPMWWCKCSATCASPRAQAVEARLIFSRSVGLCF